MNKKLKYIAIGFINAFGSSKSFYPTKRLWEITNNIQNKRIKAHYNVEKDGKSKLASLYQ